MLLYLTILCGIFCTAWGQEDKAIVVIPKEEVKAILKAAQDCGKEHGVDPNDLQKVLMWTYPNDEPHKKFLYCIFLNTEYIHEEGHFNIEKVLKTMLETGTQEDYKNNIEGCNKLTKENKYETSYEVFGCFHKHYIPKMEE